MIDTVGWIVLGAVLIVVSVVSVAAFRRHSFFGNGSCLVIGTCVGLLSAIGISQVHTSVVPVPESISPGFGGILIPYASLGITLLILLIAMLVLRCWKLCSRATRDFSAWRKRRQRHREIYEKKHWEGPRFDLSQKMDPLLDTRKTENWQLSGGGNDGSEKIARRRNATDWKSA